MSLELGDQPVGSQEEDGSRDCMCLVLVKKQNFHRAPWETVTVGFSGGL